MTARMALARIACVTAIGVSLACGDDAPSIELDASTRIDSGPRADAAGTDAQVGADAEVGADAQVDASTIDPDAGSSAACPDGPLAAPLPACRPARLPSSGDPVQDCVDRINQLRWECQCLPPLARWTEGEGCAQMHAEYDSSRSPHSGFRDRICTPGGNGQNECPGYGSVDQTIGLCLQQMWDEGPGEPFSEHGHYLNMTNPSFGRVACGFYETSGGQVWAIQNFGP